MVLDEAIASLEEPLRQVTSAMAAAVGTNVPTRMALRFTQRELERQGWQSEQVFDPFGMMIARGIGIGSPHFLAFTRWLFENPDVSRVFLVDAAGTPLTLSGPSDESTVWNFGGSSYLIRYFELAGPRFDPHVFAECFSTLSEELRSGMTHFALRVPLMNLDLPDGAVAIDDSLRVRPVPDEELARWLEADESFKMTGGSVIAAIECTYSQSRTSPPSVGNHEQLLASERVDRLLQAIQLVTNTDVFGMFREERPTGILGRGAQWRSGRGLPISFTPRGKLTAEAGDALVPTYMRIAEAERHRGLELALRRWTDATFRMKAEDRLLDYWIALEAMLCHDSNQEVQFRASLRLAKFIGRSASERYELYDAARASYRCRSDIVHGGSLAKWNLAEETGRARDWVRRAILRMLSLEESADVIVDRALLA